MREGLLQEQPPDKIRVVEHHREDSLRGAAMSIELEGSVRGIGGLSTHATELICPLSITAASVQSAAMCLGGGGG